MAKAISIQEHWEDSSKPVLIDVRTPAEFAKGHIPGAVNLPLFTNEERAIVGTTYKQRSPEEALLEGLDFVGPKMSAYIRKAQTLATDKRITVHCWRGGKRSFSMAWLLGIAGFEVQTLAGGYKAYRNLIHEDFENIKQKIVVLGGRTGCGKTIILHELEKLGEQVIDLEGMANHKGSAFGWIGEEVQPSVEQFENNLYAKWKSLDPEKRVWVENESRTIGSIYLPQAFWDQMKASPLINIEIPLNERIDILVKMYGNSDKSLLVRSFEKIKKRLGGQNLNKAMEHLEEGDLGAAAEIALSYYDKSYQRLLEKNDAPNIKMEHFENQSATEIAQYLINNTIFFAEANQL